MAKTIAALSRCEFPCRRDDGALSSVNSAGILTWASQSQTGFVFHAKARRREKNGGIGLPANATFFTGGTPVLRNS